MSKPTLSDDTSSDGTRSEQSTGDSPLSVKTKLRRKTRRRAISSRDVFLFLVAFRILNALCIRTFFQPDEYFQSLEPAWLIAFGKESGPWITWEWKYHLRSSSHPYLFSAVYWSANHLCSILQLDPATRAEVLLVAPKLLQALIAAIGDYYTWKLAQKVYGKTSLKSGSALALSACNPWQWFCSTRTLSNCLETTLTIAALNFWPWHMSLAETLSDSHDLQGLRIEKLKSEVDEEEDESDLLSKSVHQWQELERQLSTWERDRLRICLLLAAFACILRPTNVLVWICLTGFSLLNATTTETIVLVREIVLCGSIVASVTGLLDYSFYGEWTFPPFQFLLFNIAKSLAVFYGRNDWHYYVSQGFPLLLTTLLPFAIISLYNTIRGHHSNFTKSLNNSIRFQLATVIIFVPLILSFISHKEVRFIYPLLPMLHVLVALPFASYFAPVISSTPTTRNKNDMQLKAIILTGMAIASLAIAVFATEYHQRAPLSVLEFLRKEHESHYLTQPPASAHLARADTTMTVGFLMPCHSTPWRSHLIHPDIKAWALGCEPPIDLDLAERRTYRDEADQFYDNPKGFLLRTLGSPPKSKGILGNKKAKNGLGQGFIRPSPTSEALNGQMGSKHWPEYLVFFEGLEETLVNVTAGSEYSECWRGWNSFFHDDARRRGDIVVWCLRSSGLLGNGHHNTKFAHGTNGRRTT